MRGHFSKRTLLPGYGGLALRIASAQAAALAPSTDVQIGLGIRFLFGLLDPGCPFRNLTLSLFNKSGKFDCPCIRNFDVWRCASNPHGCDGSVDLHVASLRYLASNKSERSFA